MKICFITDIHFGIHSNSEEFLKYQKKFFDEYLFPYLEENGIREIISLGDEFDNRKNINFNTLNECESMFFDRIEDENYRLKIIIGNHNIYHKQFSEVNSPRLLFHRYRNINIIEKPTEVDYAGTKIMLIPWINKSNEGLILKALADTDAKFLGGHFEIPNIRLHNNWEFESGVDHNILKKFDAVWSGHYHMKIKRDNFMYFGCPCQLDWGDISYDHGFHIFDTETKKLEFVENPLRIFNVIEYSESNVIDIDTYNYEFYKISYIRVILNETISEYSLFDLFIKRLEEVAYDVKTDEKFFENVTTNLTTDVKEYKDESTLDVIKNTCHAIEMVDKDKLFKYMQKGYIKSKAMMSV